MRAGARKVRRSEVVVEGGMKVGGCVAWRIMVGSEMVLTWILDFPQERLTHSPGIARQVDSSTISCSPHSCERSSGVGVGYLKYMIRGSDYLRCDCHRAVDVEGRDHLGEFGRVSGPSGRDG